MILQVENLSKTELMDLITGAINTALNNQSPTAQSTSAGEKLLKVADVCELLKISVPTLYLWKRNGVIPFRRMGRRIFFVENEVIDAMKLINGKRA